MTSNESEYVLTTEEARNAFVQTSVWFPLGVDNGDAFDRFLATYAAEQQALALREFADDPETLVPGINEGEYVMGINYAAEYMRNLARDRATRLEREGRES